MPKSIEIQPNTPRPRSVLNRLQENGQHSYRKLYQVPDCILVAAEYRRIREINDPKIADLLEDGMVGVEQVFRDIWCQETQIGEFINNLLDSLPENLQGQFQTEIDRVLAAKRWSLGGLKGALVRQRVISSSMIEENGDFDLPDAVAHKYGLLPGEKLHLSKRSKLRQSVAQEQTNEIVAAVKEYLSKPQKTDEAGGGEEPLLENVQSVVVMEQPMAVGANGNGNGYHPEPLIFASTGDVHLPTEPLVDSQADTQPTRVKPINTDPVAPFGGESHVVMPLRSEGPAGPDVTESQRGVIPVETALDDSMVKPKPEVVSVGNESGALDVPVEQLELTEEEIIAERRRQYERDLDRIIYRRGIREGFRELGRLLLGVISKKWQRSYVENLRAQLFERLVLNELETRMRRPMKIDWKEEYAASKRLLKTFDYNGLAEYVGSLIDKNMLALAPENEQQIPFEYSGVKRKRN